MVSPMPNPHAQPRVALEAPHSVGVAASFARHHVASTPVQQQQTSLRQRLTPPRALPFNLDGLRTGSERFTQLLQQVRICMALSTLHAHIPRHMLTGQLERVWKVEDLSIGLARSLLRTNADQAWACSAVPMASAHGTYTIFATFSSFESFQIPVWRLCTP